ncbi:MAG: iron-sulfur cluster assembly scaffold protein, partial [Sinobacteraceae bacterium]|nr:iron-sulfur cluster assembly scaffold protein [Nevskiaceae bacterium]
VLAEGADVATAEARSMAARAVLALSAQRVEGRLATIRFQALGDPAVIAVGQWLCEYCQGRKLTELSSLAAADISSALDIREDRLHCALLGEDALAALLVRF